MILPLLMGILEISMVIWSCFQTFLIVAYWNNEFHFMTKWEEDFAFSPLRNNLTSSNSRKLLGTFTRDNKQTSMWDNWIYSLPVWSYTFFKNRSFFTKFTTFFNTIYGFDSFIHNWDETFWHFFNNKLLAINAMCIY